MAAASGPVRLQRCVTSPAGRHSASLIFLHGSGDSGQGLKMWIKQVLNQDLTFQHIKIIYPTAPPRLLKWMCVYPEVLQSIQHNFDVVFLFSSVPPTCPRFWMLPKGRSAWIVGSFQPYTPMKGRISTVWFDRFKISNDCPEHLESIDIMCQVLTDLIDDEVRSGIKKNRILVGGFSMGGCMAMHLAYRNHQDVAGVFALSSFLNKASVVYQALQKSDGVLPELFQCHGTADELVLHSWDSCGEHTGLIFDRFTSAVIDGHLPRNEFQYHRYTKGSYW
ncbi:lysophospholipase-like protein 1 isoform X2 [Manis javanica]|uniref:lysophospholipase-like protein 1 isoform X2 n=1 Tax=Manis javanica TaxID=9974 RepID=UPI003C6D0E6E